MAVNYSISFHILATDSGWNETELLACFRDGLNKAIQLELLCRDEGLDLRGYVVLAIRLVQHLRGQGQHPQTATHMRRCSFHELSSQCEGITQSHQLEGVAKEAMEVSSSWLPAEERRQLRMRGSAYIARPLDIWFCNVRDEVYRHTNHQILYTSSISCGLPSCCCGPPFRLWASW